MKVSEPVIRRLPRYYRYLQDLMEEGVLRISSRELSKIMGLTASQIRQDLNCFGGFGQQGYGYKVADLYNEIGTILGTSKENNLVILGAGNLGKAISNYANFKKRGFNMKAIFDIDPDMVGKTINNIPVYHLDDLERYLSENKIDIAVFAIPAAGVKKVLDTVINSGIRGIWNFSYLDLKVPDHIAMVNVHLSDSLMTLSYKMHCMEDNE